MSPSRGPRPAAHGQCIDEFRSEIAARGSGADARAGFGANPQINFCRRMCR